MHYGVSPKMISLPAGITGFGNTISPEDWKSRRKTVINLIYNSRDRVIDEVSCENRVTPNFHIIRTSRVSVIVHEFHPFIACISSSHSNSIDLHFVDWEELRGQSAHNDEWIFLQPSFLNSSVVPEHTQDLLHTELSQIEYWKPQRVGDLIFNHWD